jgi:hypothetical protein
LARLVVGILFIKSFKQFEMVCIHGWAAEVEVATAEPPPTSFPQLLKLEKHNSTRDEWVCQNINMNH